VARTLEFVFTRLPLGCATEVRATGEDDEKPPRLADDPNTIGHQESLIDSQVEIRGIADGKNWIGFIKCARKEKPEKEEQIDAQIAPGESPNDAPSSPVNGICGGSICLLPFSGRFRLRRGGRCGNGSCLRGLTFVRVRHKSANGLDRTDAIVTQITTTFYIL